MKTIDFVVLYVDGSDLVWREKMLRYRGGEQTKAPEVRYRDYGVFRYWFRAVAENAPWVHKIYVVSDRQTPEWLNTDDEKIVAVDHSDFIPEKYLPLFNSAAINCNVHRIPGLSDTFVLFDDDTYLNAPVREEDFFVNGLPKYYAGQSLFEQRFLYTFDYMLFASMTAANRSVPREVIRKTYRTKLFNPVLGAGAWRNFLLALVGGTGRVSKFEDEHLAVPILRTTMEELWQKETRLLEKTSSDRFREIGEVNPYLFRYYDCARGNFIPRARWNGFYIPSAHPNEAWEADIREGKNRCICLNDGGVPQDKLSAAQQRMFAAFEARYPNKCRFEK